MFLYKVNVMPAVEKAATNGNIRREDELLEKLGEMYLKLKSGSLRSVRDASSCVGR